MKTGWIKLHRELFTEEWEWFGDANTTLLFICLVTMANHKESCWRGQKIPVGSVLTGRKQLSKWTGISERGIRTSINRLKSTSKVTIKTTNKYSIISIKNYSKYQVTDQLDAIKRPASDHIQEYNKNIKNNTSELKKEIAKERKQLRGIEKSLKDNLPLEEIKKIALKYQVKEDLVAEYKEAYTLWIQEKPRDPKRHDRDMRASVQGWIRRDLSAKKIKPQKSWIEQVREELNGELY